MKKLLIALATLLVFATPAYAAGKTAPKALPKVLHRQLLLELYNDMAIPEQSYSFVQDGRRIDVLATPTPHQNERWVSINGSDPQLVVDTHNMIAEGATGSGSFIGFNNAYSACADLGSGLCLTSAGLLQLADPIAETIVFSSATPFSLTAAGGATITHISTTNPLTVSVSNAAANGVGVSFTASSLPTPAAQNNYAGGVAQVQVPEPTSTSTPAPNALEFTGNIAGGGTGGPYIVAMDMGSGSRDGIVFGSNGTCTGIRKALQFLNGGTASTNWFVTCSGNMQNAGTFQYGTSPFTANATGTNEFDSNSTGATVPFMDVSSNASAPTGAWFQVCYTSGGGSCATQQFTVQNDGSALARGAHGQTALCGQTTSNASPSLVTLTGWACKLTSGSASATVFTITYPGSVTLGNAPICLVQDLAAVVSEPTCTTTTTTATLTYSAAPGAVAFANIVLFKNGP